MNHEIQSARPLMQSIMFAQAYWAKIDWALNKEHGVGVVQGITIPEASKSALWH